MADKKTGYEEVEALLQDIGTKIEELIQKGTEQSGEAKVEIEKKIRDLREKRTTLEEEFRMAREKAEKLYFEKREELEPKIQESSVHFSEAFRQVLEGLKVLLGSRK